MLAMLCFVVIASAGQIHCTGPQPAGAVQRHLTRIAHEDPAHTNATAAGLRDPFLIDETDPRWNSYAPPEFRR